MPFWRGKLPGNSVPKLEFCILLQEIRRNNFRTNIPFLKKPLLICKLAAFAFTVLAILCFSNQIGNASAKIYLKSGRTKI